MNMLELVLLAFVAVAAAGFLWAYMGWQKTRGALDELTQILNLGGGFYPFQRT